MHGDAKILAKSCQTNRYASLEQRERISIE